MAQTTAIARPRFAAPAFRLPQMPAVFKRRSSKPSPKLLQLKSALASARSKARENAGGKAMTMINVAAVGIGGGVLAVFLKRLFGDEIMGMDIRMVGGGVVVGIAVLGLKKGKLAEALAMAGAGAIACYIQDIAEEYIPDMGSSEEA